MIRIVSIACIAAACAAVESYDYANDPLMKDWYRNQRPNQTNVRERKRDIQNTWWDVRNPLTLGAIDVAPDGGWIDWPAGTLRTSYRNWTALFPNDAPLAYEPGTAPGSDPLLQRRSETAVQWTQNTDLLGWMGAGWHDLIGLEVGMYGARQKSRDVATATGQEDVASWNWGDPTVDLTWSLYDSRYGGLTLLTGVSLPLGQSEDWILAHQTFGGRLGLRGAFSLGMFNIGIDGHTSGNLWNGSNKTPGEAATNIDNKFLRVGGSLHVSYRATQWFRFALEQTAEYRVWNMDPSEDLSDIQQVEAPANALAEVLLPYGLTISGGVGYDLLNHDGLEKAADRMRYGGTLMWTYGY